MKHCYFCNNGIQTIDYKNTDVLSKFIDSHAKISQRRATAVCAKHQRKLSQAIKRARYMALMPYIAQ